jgi:5'-3' exonuclease
MSYQRSCRHVALRTRRLQGTRPMISWRRLLPRRSDKAVRCWSRAVIGTPSSSPATTILFPVRAGEMARIGPAEVRERYGVEPKQVPEFIALRGDPSDKLPGARGVGPKGAADLLRQYGSLDAILSAGRFPSQAEALRLYRSIATMNASAPLPDLPDQAPTWARASELARAWGLKQLADRLAERSAASRR